MLALDPPDGGADDRRDRRDQRLRAAARPLRRRARSRGRHARGARRRHRAKSGRQGDQERGRLRPGQAVHRLSRDARRDPRGVGAAAPAAARDRHAAVGRRRRPRSRAAPPRWRTRAEQMGLTCAGRRARAWCWRASAARRRGRRPRRPSGCCARPGWRPSSATTPPLWPAQRDAQRSPAGSSCACRRLQTDLAARRGPWRKRHGAALVGPGGLTALSWLRLDEGQRRGGAAGRHCRAT